MTSKTIKVVKGLPIDKATQEIAERIYKMTRSYVVVGIPSSKTERKQDDKPKRKKSNKQGDENVNNASLAYLHENGSPADRIPPRQFMKPGINMMKGIIPRVLSNGIRRELDGYKGATIEAMNAVGRTAAEAIQDYIMDGSHLAPLADSTIRRRAEDRENSTFHANKSLYEQMRQSGASRREAQAAAGYKPLIDTGSLVGSITYGIRKDGED